MFVVGFLVLDKKIMNKINGGNTLFALFLFLYPYHTYMGRFSNFARNGQNGWKNGHVHRDGANDANSETAML